MAEQIPTDLSSLPPLTDRQAELLRYIWEYWVQYRFTPTQREMCTHMSINSNNAGTHLNALERKGYIQRGNGRRNVSITPSGAEKLAIMGGIDDAQMGLFGENEKGDKDG